MHWSVSYVGKPYSRYDCAGLVADVARKVFNYPLVLPQERCDSAFSNTVRIKDGVRQLTKKVDCPKEPDLVVMITKKRLWHCGIFVEIPNKGAWCLHSLQEKNVCLHRINFLETIGCEIEGYYRWLFV